MPPILKKTQAFEERKNAKVEPLDKKEASHAMPVGFRLEPPSQSG
jgi:hypothetical protein